MRETVLSCCVASQMLVIFFGSLSKSIVFSSSSTSSTEPPSAAQVNATAICEVRCFKWRIPDTTEDVIEFAETRGKPEVREIYHDTSAVRGSSLERCDLVASLSGRESCVWLGQILCASSESPRSVFNLFLRAPADTRPVSSSTATSFLCYVSHCLDSHIRPHPASQAQTSACPVKGRAQTPGTTQERGSTQARRAMRCPPEFVRARERPQGRVFLSRSVVGVFPACCLTVLNVASVLLYRYRTQLACTLSLSTRLSAAPADSSYAR